jgi:hypothetical protein
MDTYTYIPLTQGKMAIVDTRMVKVLPSQKWQYNGKTSKNTGYAQFRMYTDNGRKTVQMHRFIWESVYGPIPDGLFIDHINGNGLDNRIANLRLADQRLQSINTVQRRSGLTSSRYPGVNRDHHAHKWIAHITFNSVQFHLGCFDDELEAHKAYLNALDAYNKTGETPKPKPTTSKYKGVYWRTREQKWAASIQINKKRYELGYFTHELDAFNAYQSALNSYKADGTLPRKGLNAS